MSGAIDREAIYAALFALASSSSDFTTKSRAVRPFTEVSAAEMPALFIEQGKQRAVKMPPAPTKWTLTADLILYVTEATPNGTVDIATQLNTYVDAIDAVLAPSPATDTQTLDGLVTDARIVGEIDIYEGRLNGGRVGIAVIPVEIIANA